MPSGFSLFTSHFSLLVRSVASRLTPPDQHGKGQSASPGPAGDDRPGPRPGLPRIGEHPCDHRSIHEGKEQKGQAVGSGTIISTDGYTLTNFHVADNGKKFKCTLADKQEISADLVGEDPLTDLAVLKLNLKELRDPLLVLPAAKFGDFRTLYFGATACCSGTSAPSRYASTL